MGKMFKFADHKYWFWILKIIVFLADIVYSVKLLSNHEATLSFKNLEYISNFEVWGLTLVAHKKYSVNKEKISKICRIFEYWIIPGALVVHLILIVPFSSFCQPCFFRIQWALMLTKCCFTYMCHFICSF